MMAGFDSFVGIDWSGDKAPWQKGLKVAIASPGRAAPQLQHGPAKHGRWSRHEVIQWVKDRFSNKRALIGFDFAFGFPPVALTGELVLDWEYVERICHADPNFYGGAFFRPPAVAHSHLVNSRWLPKLGYSAGCLRMTDRAAKQTIGATPQSIFNAVGPAQVGPSSISGMRALRMLRLSCGDRIGIWPLTDVSQTRSVIVEIFPRYYPLSKKLSARLADHHALNAALAAFDSEAVEVAPRSEDEGDALLSAAALRYLSRQQALFRLPERSIRSQGWIFGVPVWNGMTS